MYRTYVSKYIVRRFPMRRFPTLLSMHIGKCRTIYLDTYVRYILQCFGLKVALFVSMIHIIYTSILCGYLLTLLYYLCHLQRGTEEQQQSIARLQKCAFLKRIIYSSCIHIYLFKYINLKKITKLNKKIHEMIHEEKI